MHIGRCVEERHIRGAQRAPLPVCFHRELWFARAVGYTLVTQAVWLSRAR